MEPDLTVSFRALWFGRVDAEAALADKFHTPLVPASVGAMNDRLTTAMAELVAALRDEIAVEHRPSEREPDRLLSIEQAARALGVGRTALYSEIGAGRIRSVKVGRRRLVPASAISEVASGRE